MSAIENVKFAPNSVIFKEGDKPNGVYYILSGNVEISRVESGTKILLANLGADDVFGEMAIIDNSIRSATAFAKDSVECMRGDEKGFSATLSSTDPEIKASMQKLVAVIREKNKSKKAQMSKTDIVMAAAIKQKCDKIRNEILSNASLVDKIKKVDPFINGVFNSLLAMAKS